ncbi:MAG: hypothetical protein AB1458_11915 [Bacteroidota bacterium]
MSHQRIRKRLYFKWSEFGNGKKFLEIVLDKEPLYVYLGFKYPAYVTLFGYFPVAETHTLAYEEYALKRQTALPDNRIQLYVCDQCGDIYCTSITAELIDRGDEVAWADIAKQNEPGHLSELIGVDDIVFEKEQYLAELSRIKNMHAR